jgi:hypothetical protein
LATPRWNEIAPEYALLPARLTSVKGPTDETERAGADVRPGIF